MTTPPDDLVSTREARTRIGVSHPTLLTLIRTGALPAVDVGTTPNAPRYRVRERDIQKFLNDRAVTPTR